MKITTTLLSCLLMVSMSACDKKEDKKDAPKTDKKSETKGDAKTPAGDAKAKAEPEAKLPEMEEIALAEWGIKVKVPKGAKADEMEAGDAELEMPDSAKLTTESACGYDVDLTRHWAKSLDSMYDNSKKGVDGLTEVEWLKDEKTPTGYTIHYKGKAPLGDMYGVSTGLVVGDRLVLCDIGLGRLDKKEADCLLPVCTSITAGGGDDAKAADAKAGDAKAADAKAADAKAGDAKAADAKAADAKAG